MCLCAPLSTYSCSRGVTGWRGTCAAAFSQLPLLPPALLRSVKPQIYTASAMRARREGVTAEHHAYKHGKTVGFLSLDGLGINTLPIINRLLLIPTCTLAPFFKFGSNISQTLFFFPCFRVPREVMWSVTQTDPTLITDCITPWV